jgi:succinate-acetate transporter protein
MSEKLGNPGVVGLAGFGATTLLLQFHNLGWAGSGVVIWCAIAFGGLAQLIAGLLEFKTGNNFGFAAFTTYGAFWLALAGILGTSKALGITGTDIGWFLVTFTLITAIFFVGSMKQNSALAFTFLTLLLGFIGLDISHLSGLKIFTQIAAWDLILCGLSAWYTMSHIAFQGLGWHLSLGKPWIK